MTAAKLTGNMIDRKVKMPRCLDWLDVVGPSLDFFPQSTV